MDKKERVVCTRCLGDGVLKIEDPLYLEGFRLERCGCVCDKETDFNIPKLYLDKDFTNFKGHRDLIKNLLDYVDTYTLGSKGLYFYGPTGAGKTHLSVTLLVLLARTKGVRGKYVSVIDHLNLKRKVYEQQELESTIVNFEEAELLLLDDLGVGKTSEWVEEQLTCLIDFRYRKGLTTFFTSNYSPHELKRYFSDIVTGYRISSRILEMCHVYNIDFPDYRLKHIQEQKYE